MTEKGESMPPKRKSPRTPYPYTILPFSGDPSRIRTTRPEWVNEYFLIEALLRSKPVMKAYRPDDPSTVITKLRASGITGQDPLKGTHHALLSEPLEDHEWVRKMAQLGDLGLGILDLGVIAKLPPKVKVQHNTMHVTGTADGLGDCKSYLLDPNPRYVCLRIDAAKPVETILQRLRVLLRDRHQQAIQSAFPHHPDGGWREFSRRLKQIFFRNIPAWLAYVCCYDLYQSGLTIKAAGGQVYPDDPNATEKASVAIRRVKFVIRHAERLAAEQERFGKQRVKKPGTNKFFWPPRRIPE